MKNKLQLLRSCKGEERGEAQFSGSLEVWGYWGFPPFALHPSVGRSGINDH
jgi:hypothetical protein